MGSIAVLHKGVDKPAPVERGLHDDPVSFIL
jgi:hypothetical protein